MKQSWLEAIKKIGVFRIALILLAGVVLILCSVPLPGSGTTADKAEKETEEVKTEEFPSSYGEQMERKLEAILEEVEGIRSARVMITLASGTQKIIDKDESVQLEQQSEAGQDGSDKLSSKENRESTTVLTEQKDSSRVPYVLKELSPEVEGVLVVLEGEITPTKTAQVSEAVQALFGIEAHKVKVLEKKMQAEG